jgi:isopenicillin N synthase-like dioxygenase
MRSNFSHPMLFLRPLHYSARVSRPANGVFAAGAHTDYGMLTLLATDGVPGLQILKNHTWLDVPSLPGALIVNLGDMLERYASLTCDAAVGMRCICASVSRCSMQYVIHLVLQMDERHVQVDSASCGKHKWKRQVLVPLFLRAKL